MGGGDSGDGEGAGDGKGLAWGAGRPWGRGGAARVLDGGRVLIFNFFSIL